jgi:PPOX class probable F420-dependent enzyme
LVSIPQSHLDLITSNQTVILATRGADAFPQVTALWFVADEEGAIQLSINTARQKAKNLQRRPEATLFFTDPANPYRTLEFRVIANVQPDPDYVLANKVGAKYGADLSTMDQPGETRVAVSFEVVKVNTFG